MFSIKTNLLSFNMRMWMLSLCLICSTLEGRIYFLHISKTGGTTLRYLLEKELSAEEIYPLRNTSVRLVPIHHALVSGHFSYAACKNVDLNFGSAFKIVILRDPVERFLSFLRWKKRSNPHFDLDDFLVQKESMMKNEGVFGLSDNAMCRFLTDDPNLVGEQLLENAKRNLEKIDYVVFFDRYNDDVVELFDCLGIAIDPIAIPIMNKTVKEPISLALQEEVERLNELDIRLYDYAQTTLKKNNRRTTLRTGSYDHILEKRTYVDYTFDQPLNGNGWGHRDQMDAKGPYHRWVMDEQATIIFHLEEGQDYDIFFHAFPIVTEFVPRLKVNGFEVEVEQLSQGKPKKGQVGWREFSNYYARISKEKIGNGEVELTFFGPSFSGYEDLLQPKPRKLYKPLSFALNHITISVAGK